MPRKPAVTRESDLQVCGRFNEAGAEMPRKPRRFRLAKLTTRRRFNEAGAEMPRKPKTAISCTATTC